MKKRAIAALLVFGACGGGSGEWAQEQQDAFLENCEQSSGGMTSACECMLEKVMADYDNPNDVVVGDMQGYAEECAGS